jgi:hypothetical protein
LEKVGSQSYTYSSQYSENNKSCKGICEPVPSEAAIKSNEERIEAFFFQNGHSASQIIRAGQEPVSAQLIAHPCKAGLPAIPKKGS